MTQNIHHCYFALPLAVFVMLVAAPLATAQCPPQSTDVFAEIYPPDVVPPGHHPPPRATIYIYKSDGTLIYGGTIRSRAGCDWRWELFGKDGQGDFECDLGVPPCDDETFVIVMPVAHSVTEQKAWLYAPQASGVEGLFLFPNDWPVASPDFALGIFRNTGEVKARPRSPSPNPIYYEDFFEGSYVIPYNFDYYCDESGDCVWPQSFVTPYDVPGGEVFPGKDIDPVEFSVATHRL